MIRALIYRKGGFLFFTLLMGMITHTAQAQNGGFAGASTRLGFSARGMAMGNSLSAVTTQGAYAYYNPAQAALLIDYKPLDITVGALKYDRTFQTSGIQLPLPPTAGLAFGLLRAGVQDLDGRTESGYPTSRFDISEYQFMSAFGIRLGDKLNAGIGLKFGLARYQQELGNSMSLGVDFGLLYSLHDNLNMAFTVKDLFANYSWDSGDQDGFGQTRRTVNHFPTRLLLGIAYQANDITISGEYEVQIYRTEQMESEFNLIDGEPTEVSRLNTLNTHSEQLRLGMAWLIHERVTLRGGWQLPDIAIMDSWTYSTGFSLHLPFDIFSPSIDYAFVAEPNRISNMHVFTLRLNL